MRCITVYTKDFARFSDILEDVLSVTLASDEQTTIDGVAVHASGDVPEHYVHRMRQKKDVVIMRDVQRNIVILQRGDVFEVLVHQHSSEAVGS
ncbi:MAG: NAD/NADP transhydrogenase alpha subunit [Paenibacillaceae bacterium]|nr:NAD/NADP transhydrogenase alpha subunit [Paenibacillaceae bacterium]